MYYVYSLFGIQQRAAQKDLSTTKYEHSTSQQNAPTVEVDTSKPASDLVRS